MPDMATIFSLQGKTVLVTGASSGIGQACAIACSQAGATVCLTGRNIDRLNQTVAQLSGENHKIFPCELTSEQERNELVSQLPKLDGVVHCAGIARRQLCKFITPQDVEEMLGVNFVAPILLQSLLQAKKKLNKQGAIVWLSSMAAISPNVGNALYSASKSAIVSYAQCLALELAPQKIRVNCIAPAMVKTGMSNDFGMTSEDVAQDEQRYPLRRYGEPQDVANLAIYLLSDASSWMTGTTIDLTGGCINP